jgi:predicted RNA-binding protein associated with RNAse of E/G family
MPVINQPITVIKRNLSGEEMWKYSGVMLKREAHNILLEARFQRPDLPFLGIVLKNGDRFLETYFTDRWYNIYEIHDRDDDHIKGWYCNIGKPAIMESEEVISYVDLALDLWVAPDGNQTVLDKDEFVALNLDKNTRARARAALKELQKRFLDNDIPAAN